MSNPTSERLTSATAREAETEPGAETTVETEADTAARTSEETRCPECDGQLVHDEAHGETVCADCGLVVADDEIDRGAEWRAFDADEREKKTRVGAPETQTLHDKGLSTTIDWRDQDAKGNPLSAKKRRRLARLRTWNERFHTKDSSERNLKQALGEIQRLAAALGLPDSVHETAAVIYRRALDDGLLPGRSIEGVATASLYAATRLTDTPRTLDDITPVCRVDKREVARTYRYINHELNLPVQPPDPVSYLPRFCSDLSLPDTTERQARELLETAKRENVHAGKSPVGLAAAAIYAAGLLTNHHVTQREIADVTDISAVTIRNRYQELFDAADVPTPV